MIGSKPSFSKECINMKQYQFKQLSLVLIVTVTTLVSCTTQSVSVPTATSVPTSPYVPLLDSAIRGLSPEEIKELESGAGAGFARAAELNGYPGPRHILDLQDKLDLTEDQFAEVQKLYDDMNSEARQMGAEILRLESELELAFREGTIDNTTLEAKVSDLAEKYGALRLLHLRTHLTAIQLLTPDQLMLYNQLRGYSQPDSPDHDGGHNP
jgi:Spy/CpxP family protein refolding chaperone